MQPVARTPRSPWLPLVLATAAILVGCDRCSQDKPATDEVAATSASPSSTAPADAKVQATDLVVGNGAEAVDGKKLSVLYTGTLADGKTFDSNQNRDDPFSFVLGSGLVIAGWEQGLRGMRVGGRRRLVIPPEAAYGSSGFAGVIPPNATLTFEIELLKVE
jgi:FKBP-type peptidyl-prolyl cis-trans isomerase